MWVWLLLHLRFIPDKPEIMASPHWLVLLIFMDMPTGLFTKLEGIGLFTDFGIYGWKCYNIHVQCFKWLWGFLFIYFSGAILRREIFRIYEVRWIFSSIKAALNLSWCPQWRQQCHTSPPPIPHRYLLLPFYDKLWSVLIVLCLWHLELIGQARAATTGWTPGAMQIEVPRWH